MKKILFISVRNPFSGRFSGDVIRSKKFIQYFSKRNIVEIACLGENNKITKFHNITLRTFKKRNFIFFLLNILFSFLKFQPIHLCFFFSPYLRDFVKNNCNKYNVIFCQSIRSFQYVPNQVNSRIILDMGDLYSKNYFQTYKSLFYLNPLKIIYFIESKFVKRYEKYCLTKANKVLLFSKREIQQLNLNSKIKNKIIQINFGVDRIKNLYKFCLKNNKIIFIGNNKYTPNRQACLKFIKEIFPKLRQKYPDIEFHILGEINFIDRYFLMRKSGVKIFGKIKNLESNLSKVICGLANLHISTGIQTKLLTYMSYGIPSISSEMVYKNFDSIRKLNICYYKSNDNFFDLIVKLKENKVFSKKYSEKSIKIVKKFKWEETLKIFDKII